MNKIAFIYDEAVEHTKKKVCDDIIFYMQDKEKIPSYADYVQERKHYVEQIWLNVWMNQASNRTPRVEKKEYLRSRGFEVEGVDRKIINKLFRNEIKAYHPFPIEAWCYETYAEDLEQWTEMYKKARDEYNQRQEAEALQKKKRQLWDLLENEVYPISAKQQHLFYLYTRKFIADELKVDFNTKIRYQRINPYEIEERLVPIGVFIHEDYSLVKDFFSEVTGNIQKVYVWNRYDYEYETYYDLYEAKVREYLSNLIPKKIKSLLLSEFYSSYEETVIESVLSDILNDIIDDFSSEFIMYLGDEYLTNLLRLAEIPFDEKQHETIFLADVQERERRKAEEKAERERKKAEEARILRDIFEFEYNPPNGRNVNYILHIGETNTGKTYHALMRMMEAESGLYLAPLRLLALEVYDFLNTRGTACTLKTGEEEKETPGARHLSSTVEMFREKDFYNVVVIDEAQMISDKDRGFSWYKAITKVQANEIHIIASKNARDMLVQLLGDSNIEIIEYKRDTPLQVEEKEFNIKKVRKGDALICFSRKRVLETASRLQNDGHSVSMIYGSMPPETRKKQVERFILGETSVVVSTDAIGMGINLPIRRIVFLENSKFDGTKRRLLTSQEVKQIAGRAGRKGLYNIGKVAFTADVKKMSYLLSQEDEPIHTFAIAPTNSVFERFQKYYRDLGTFFELWEKFKSPKGTKKASLTEERELYERIRGTEMEARLSLMDLYGLLHLPFSAREPELIRQWEKTVEAIVAGHKLPEPRIKKRTLEDLELTYKAIGLHLLFLYRLNKRTDAVYWERLREEISGLVHEQLKNEVKNMQKKCRQCKKKLSWDHPYSICDSCYTKKYKDYYDY
ncbi:helicase-related protein [Niallia endozanthoxylica]|uniref:RNA helicase n=1 Tax=Niallia endozanthoxylica TaxID=2036016 RepID=A0A5J5HU64_9BACI|nr:helicase-related protein [Niallia endozanthoxylica]KAA9025721.1 RNA helicase [Niallia endozanthoxylica]